MADGVAAHGAHDPTTIAAAAGRAGPSAIARALLAACADCTRLYADLQALAVALPLTATPSRPRDFTLTSADAERLRPRGLRQWFGRIGSARDTITRPLAIGFTTLGLAGLLLATVPGALPFASSAGGARLSPVEAPMTLEMATPMATAGDAAVTVPGDAAVTVPGDVTVGLAAPTPVDDRADASPVVVLSAAFLVVGGGLFVVRRANGPRRMR